MRFLAAGFCVPVVPESGILVGMYEIHEEVLCPEAYTRMGILDTLCAIRAKSTRAVIRLDWASNTSPERICRFYQQSGVLNRQQ